MRYVVYYGHYNYGEFPVYTSDSHIECEDFVERNRKNCEAGWSYDIWDSGEEE